MAKSDLKGKPLDFDTLAQIVSLATTVQADGPERHKAARDLANIYEAWGFEPDEYGIVKGLDVQVEKRSDLATAPGRKPE